eukprot:CAMPEP_0113499976 /NCGR_PEP_ID=MMETSP0014_2-20120614/32050_1 /TAXON_ID=2857 /ORGANISM="Nitzschia sp." /LENGTH=69 /DNA_ID=CAMNT_0000394217 /DNA_START=292 /DNA_END=501 /DNA_ORIENTATION=+ /assembly_acc=CAM_ASM_000159
MAPKHKPDRANPIATPLRQTAEVTYAEFTMLPTAPSSFHAMIHQIIADIDIPTPKNAQQDAQAFVIVLY